MELLEKLRLWIDPVNRPGTEAMAVDEWLLETADVPVLRIYGWEGDWASVGYFGKMTEARSTIPGVNWVRRWTGGGLVDHRADWTYTLVLPHSEPLANARGAESYRSIHAALREVLAGEGILAILSGGGEETGAALCFENPVHHDLVGADRRKIAGAGQRRTRQGLLHQGSVAHSCRGEISQQRARHLAGLLAGDWEEVDVEPDVTNIREKAVARYADSRWLEKR